MVLRSYSPSRWEVVGEIPRGPYLCRGLGFVYGVTGTLNPDATCNYSFDGIYDGYDSFRRADGAYFIWWYTVGGIWVITTAKGALGVSWWTADQAAIVGTYSPAGTATGTATVQLGEHP